MADLVSVEQTQDQDIDGLLEGSRWGFLNLTYSFPAQASYYGPNYGHGEPQNNFEGLNGIQIAAVRTILGLVGDATGLTFSEIRETETAHATLRLGMSDTNASGWAY